MTTDSSTLKEDAERVGISVEVLEFLRAQHIHFMLPMYGGMCSHTTFSSMMAFSVLASKLGMNWTVDIVSNESLITRGRNTLIAKFMVNEKATHAMFIDVDLAFDPNSILKLLLNNQDVVGGVYPAKCLPTQYVVNTVPNARQLTDDLVEVSTIGTGFLLIKRHVIEKMIAAHQHLKYNDGQGLGEETAKYVYALFDTMIDENGNYLSEDWTFCWRWRKMGGHVMANINLKIDHNGNHTFSGDADKLREHVLAKTSG